MPEKIKEEVRRLAIGRKIRTLRTKQGLSIEQVSERTSMPVVLLSQMESDVIAPTVAALVNIAKALGTTVDTFFQDAPFTDAIEVVRHGEGRQIRRLQQADATPLQYNYESLAYRLSGKRMEPFFVEFTLDPGQPPKLVSHEGEEFIYVLQGEVEFVSGEDRVLLQPGDALYFYSKKPHCLRGVGEVVPKAIAVIYPYGE
ncbi:MAG: XRE family transcriptional regulator [Candidatus Alcyoniella australis]|nr:XRE family transcriptional regulator [Candidatus Alcyoniella australis]